MKKFNGQSGLTLTETLMAVFLTSGVGLISMEAQEQSTKQVQAIQVYHTAAILRDSFSDLIRNKEYLSENIRPISKFGIKGCIPADFKPGATFTNCKMGPEQDFKLVKPSGVVNYKFIGKADGIIADGQKPVYYTDTGEVCPDLNHSNCAIGASASFQAICHSGACGGQPDLLKITVELKDNRKKTVTSSGATARTSAWNDKPSFFKFYVTHDLTLIKDSSKLFSENIACKKEKIKVTKPNSKGATEEWVPGSPVQIKDGKLQCAYYLPDNYIGAKGPRGDQPKSAPRGDKGTDCHVWGPI